MCALKKRIVDFIKSTKALNNRQFVFYENYYSSCSNECSMINDGFDSRKYVVAIYVNMKEAFDTVNHGKLLEFIEQTAGRTTCPSKSLSALMIFFKMI